MTVGPSTSWRGSRSLLGVALHSPPLLGAFLYSLLDTKTGDNNVVVRPALPLPHVFMRSPEVRNKSLIIFAVGFHPLLILTIIWEILTNPVVSLVFAVLLFLGPLQTATTSSAIAYAAPSGDGACDPILLPGVDLTRTVDGRFRFRCR
ncbi:unnamed protein product [Schistocephalus solidus]|uniref:DUF4149 domain-containing protein n=1 Tax=Schistocephalus solidus TaxID=70667 RepID=A0A183TQR1_SCHSO|nr:unnamed protein product [Schistocephalus solidus]